MSLETWVVGGFNVVTIVALCFCCWHGNMMELLSEKDGDKAGTTSFSRVAGLIGAVVLSTFFWGLANVLLQRSFGPPADIAAIKDILANLSNYFLYGSALFAPYAFNQIKSIFPSAGGAPARQPDATGANQEKPKESEGQKAKGQTTP